MSASYQWRLCSVAQLTLSVEYFLEEHPTCTMYIKGLEYSIRAGFDAARAEFAVGIFDVTTTRAVIERKILEAMLAEVS